MNQKIENKKYLEILRKIVFVALWFFTIFYMLKIGTMEYDVPRQVYFNRSFLFLIIILIVLRKIRILNIINVSFLTISIGIIIAYLYRHNSDWGETYRSVLLSKYLIISFFILIIVDMIRTKQYTRLKDLSKSVLICLLVPFFIIAVLEIESIIVLTIGCVALYLTPIVEDEWKRQLKYISIGGYLACVFIFLQSFIVSPDNFVANRYVGTFSFPVAAGVAASTGVICSIYYLVLQIRNKNKIGITASALALLFPASMELFVMNRASILGMIGLLTLTFIFFVGKNGRGAILGKAFAVIIISLFLAIIGLIFLKKISVMDIDVERISSFAGKPIGYVVGVAQYAFNEGSEYSMFEEGSLLNAIDNFSSSRLTLWIQGIKTASFLPTEDYGVFYPNGAYMPHVHSEYICLIRKYGYLGGIPIIIAHFIMLGISISRAREDKDSFLMSFMWMSYSIGMLMVEHAPWYLMPYCLMYVIIFPLLKKAET